MALLELKNLTKSFGGLTAVNELNIYVNEGEIVGLIGPNGAGKTTVFNMISGVFHPTRGQVLFNNKTIGGLMPHSIAKKGLARTFQLTTLFANMTVLENILLGFHLKSHIGYFGALFNTASRRSIEQRLLVEAKEIANFVGLELKQQELAKNLPHGSQRALEIAIALAVNPKLLLLDEPVTGMNPEETLEMMQKIKEIRGKGMTILLVEHDMKVVMGICDRIYVINFGKKIAEGSPKEICENHDVIKAYLGEAYAARN